MDYECLDGLKILAGQGDPAPVGLPGLADVRIFSGSTSFLGFGFMIAPFSFGGCRPLTTSSLAVVRVIPSTNYNGNACDPVVKVNRSSRDTPTTILSDYRSLYRSQLICLSLAHKLG